jgi:O-antigen/teichoic acid export membrane protein
MRRRACEPGDVSRHTCWQCAWHGDLDHEDWNYVTRGETQIQRLDRNYVELLQEMRVVQTGVQILLAFLLAIAFTPSFAHLSDGQRGVYLATLVLAAVTAGVLIAPVSQHRVLFRRRLRHQMVESAHRFVTMGLVCLFLTLVGAVHLAATLVIHDWAYGLTAALAVGLGTMWWAVPWRQRARHDHDHDHDVLDYAQATTGRGRDLSR